MKGPLTFEHEKRQPIDDSGIPLLVDWPKQRLEDSDRKDVRCAVPCNRLQILEVGGYSRQWHIDDSGIKCYEQLTETKACNDRVKPP